MKQFIVILHTCMAVIAVIAMCNYCGNVFGCNLNYHSQSFFLMTWVNFSFFVIACLKFQLFYIVILTRKATTSLAKNEYFCLLNHKIELCVHYFPRTCSVFARNQNLHIFWWNCILEFWNMQLVDLTGCVKFPALDLPICMTQFLLMCHLCC